VIQHHAIGLDKYVKRILSDEPTDSDCNFLTQRAFTRRSPTITCVGQFSWIPSLHFSYMI
jgi:hypothetical protein